MRIRLAVGREVNGGKGSTLNGWISWAGICESILAGLDGFVCRRSVGSG